MPYREPGMNRGSMIGPEGDPIDGGPPVETTEDGRLRRAPMLRQSKMVHSANGILPLLQQLRKARIEAYIWDTEADHDAMD